MASCAELDQQENCTRARTHAAVSAKESYVYVRAAEIRWKEIAGSGVGCAFVPGGIAGVHPKERLEVLDGFLLHARPTWFGPVLREQDR